jgi:hypothetical protein
MIYRHRLVFVLFLALFVIPAIALAQGDQCLDVIQAAFTAAEQSCSAIVRNQVCVGNPSARAEPQEGYSPFTFAQAGDIISAHEIQTLRTTLDANTYGVSILRLQAGLPDTAPDQNVTMVAFGDVEIQNGVSAADVLPTLEVSPTGNMNIRSGPSTDDSIVGMLDAFQAVTANGRLGDNSWLRVRLTDGTFGWLSTPLLTITGDMNTLDIVDSSGTPVALRFVALQSFSFRSGGAPCAGAPESGILIQTPSEVIFSINGVEIVLDGTAFMKAQPGVEMVVSSLEGLVRAGASGVAHVMLPGTQARISLDANSNPSGAPSEPEPYDAAAMQVLPVEALAREVTIDPSLTAEEIAASGIPTPGEWIMTYSILTFACADGRTEVEERFRSNSLTLEVQQEGAALVLIGTPQRDDPPFAPVVLVRTGAGYYTADATLENAFGRQSQYHFKVYVLSPDHIEGVTVGLGGDCTTTGPFTADRITTPS